MEKSIEQQKQDLQHRTFLVMFKILIVFGAPAAIAFFVGRWADQTYDMRPYGSLMALGVAFVVSWAITIRIYITLDREYKALQRQEEQQQ